MTKQLHMLTKEQAEMVRGKLEVRVRHNQHMRNLMRNPWTAMLISMGINDVLAGKDLIGSKNRPAPWWMDKSDQRIYNLGADRALDMLVPYRSVFPNVRAAFSI